LTLYLMDEPFAAVGLAYAANDPEARVVLLQDAVYLACKDGLQGKVYVVKEDVMRRGLTSSIRAGVETIGYNGLVELMEKERVLCFL